ncbi:MAG TPA: prepilin-type N-terminal cleavage/methylation domain-containing protein [Phycisphaerales bacterium]|nr:prepilin-type N-terminal cleavage/methylation domain-containing protein [Phycisphaerales bacterium]
MRTRRPNNRAFTLIEILIVVVILGILAAIVIPQFSEASTTAQQNAANSTFQTVRSQVELYKFKTGAPPASLQALVNDGYLAGDGSGNFQQPQGWCIDIDENGVVTLTQGDCD